MRNRGCIVLLLVLLVGCSVRKQPPLTLVERSDAEKEDIYKRPVHYPTTGLKLDNLWRDSLIYRQDTILIDYSPLLDFEGISRAILLPRETLVTSGPTKEFIRYFPSMSYHCDRAYTAQWMIKNNRLYLGKVSPREFYIEKGNEISPFNGKQRVKQTKVDKRIERATGRNYQDGWIFADWVNGNIKGTIGGVPDQFAVDLIVDSPQQVVIQVRNGVVESVNITPADK